METSQYRDLEVDEDLEFQRREWLVQRIAWAMLTLLLLGIMLGLLGEGPLSKASIESSDSRARLEYQRFMRHHNPDSLRLIVQARTSEQKIFFDLAYMSKVTVEKLTPEPEQTIAGNNALAYVFRTAPGAELKITLQLKPQQTGTLHGWFALHEGEKQHFRQFVYP